MKCPTADKLSQYVDEMLIEQETMEIRTHIFDCDSCNRIVRAYEAEAQFIKETIQTPSLPIDFTDQILDQLEPNKTKKKINWNRILLPAAGVLLATSLTVTFNPTLAGWIEGVFSSDRVDEGLRIANESGFTQRVNQEITNNGITLKVEDIVADTSRIAVSYQVLDEKGNAKKQNSDFFEGENTFIVKDKNGQKINIESMGWRNQDEYGLVEFVFHGKEVPEQIILNFNLKKLAGKDGNWELEIPVSLKESLLATKSIPLKNEKSTYHGINIHMKEMRYSPSTTELLYETSLDNNELKKVKNEIHQLEEKYGSNIGSTFIGYGNKLQYHIETEDGKKVFYHNSYLEGKGHPMDTGGLFGSGRDLSQLGQIEWVDSFIPQKDTNKLTFVLGGVHKTEPIDYTIKIKPEELKKNPIEFVFEGNHLKITEAQFKHNYSLQKSLMPIKKETTFNIEIVGGKDAKAPILNEWILTDKKGKTYNVSPSYSILDEKDAKGRYKTNLTLQTFDMEEVPEELTLHLLSVTRYYPLEQPWRIPLY